MNKPLTKKERSNLIDAWVKMNCFCAYFENPRHYTEKYKPKEVAREIWKHLDLVVANLYDEDL
jgi:hypothetical protein